MDVKAGKKTVLAVLNTRISVASNIAPILLIIIAVLLVLQPFSAAAGRGVEASPPYSWGPGGHTPVGLAVSRDGLRVWTVVGRALLRSEGSGPFRPVFRAGSRLASLCLDEASPGGAQLWFATEHALYRADVDGSSYERVPFPGSAEGIRALVSGGPAGQLFVATGEALWALATAGGDWRRYARFEEEDDTVYLAVSAERREGEEKLVLWTAGSGGLRMRLLDRDGYPEGGRRRLFLAGQEANDITGQLLGEVRLAVATPRGIYFRGPEGSEGIVEIRNAGAVAIRQAPAAEIWVATEKAVYRVHQKGSQPGRLEAELSYAGGEGGTGPLRRIAFGGEGRRHLWLLGSRGYRIVRGMTENHGPVSLQESGTLQTSPMVGLLPEERAAEAWDPEPAPITSVALDFESSCIRPDLARIRDAVLSRAQLAPGRFRRWARGARWKALLPSVAASFLTERAFKRGVDSDEVFTSGAHRSLIDRAIQRDREKQYRIGLEWDLSDLLFHADEIAASRENREAVELREEILAEVNRIYFERLRIGTEFAVGNGKSAAEQNENAIRFFELGARLDAWTGGLFSRECPGGRTLPDVLPNVLPRGLNSTP